jgi:hypothetical protein
MTIELTEPFESCEIIEQALDIVTGRRVIDELYDDNTFHLVRCLYSFSRKWDCPTLIYTTVLSLHYLIRITPEVCGSVFVFGAIMNNIDLCCEAIIAYAKSDDGVWVTCDNIAGRYDARSHINPSSWPYELFVLCPAPYVWALQRAYLVQEKLGTETIAYEFRKMMATASGESRDTKPDHPSSSLRIIQLTAHRVVVCLRVPDHKLADNPAGIPPGWDGDRQAGGW